MERGHPVRQRAQHAQTCRGDSMGWFALRSGGQDVRAPQATPQMMEVDSKNAASERLRAARRVVIKLGTSIVTGADGQICTEQVQPIVRSIAALKSAGRQVVLVSSGAVGLGAGRLKLHLSRLRDLVVRQACAAVGQSLLMHAYERLFRVHDVTIAQVLLTEDDFTEWERYSNLRR